MRARWLLLPAMVALLAGCGGSAGSAVAANAAPPLASARALGGAVSLFPIPGSVTASPTTQLSFRGVSAAGLGPLTVTGSSSGIHDGTLLPHSDGDGVSFLPRAPFTPGEQVTVSTGLDLRGAAAGTAMFTVAQPATVPTAGFGPTVAEPSPPADSGSYISRPDLQPPVVQVRTGSGGGDGDVLMFTPAATPSGAGPMLTDQDGSLVWFDPLPEGTGATDLKLQTYRGLPVLTWWQGQVVQPGYGRGKIEIYDTSYRKVAEVSAGNGYDADLHDVELTPDGTVLLTVYDGIRWDARSVGGSANATVLDAVVQEVDIATGAVEFEWHGLDHVPLSASVVPVPRSADDVYDYFHLNSVDEGPSGDLLISGRHLDALFDLDRSTGRVLWQLGGAGSSFGVPPDAAFSYQHDATWQPDGTITLFDNASRDNDHKDAEESSAVRLRLDTQAMTASLVWRLAPPEAFLATSQGSTQVLADGNVVVGWGSKPNVTEYHPDGRVVYDAALSFSNSYRAYLQPWVGTPGQPPTWTKAPTGVAVQFAASVTAFAVSWNGDTRTRTWQLLGGPDADHLQPVASAARTGFETLLTAPDAGSWFAVRALDANGAVLTTSAARQVTG